MTFNPGNPLFQSKQKDSNNARVGKINPRFSPKKAAVTLIAELRILRLSANLVGDLEGTTTDTILQYRRPGKN